MEQGLGFQGKKKSYRERYFEDYQTVKVPANNKKGFRMEYRYIGKYKEWFIKGRSLQLYKGLLAGIEILSSAVFLLAGLSETAFTTQKIAGGFGAMSVLCWLMEIGGLIWFIASARPVKELDYTEIDRLIRGGSVLRAMFLILSVLGGIVGLITAGAVTWPDILAAAGLLMSAAGSIAIWRLYGNLLVRTLDRNEIQ